MTKSTRLMFLGFLVMLAGAILLYSLATAIPAGTNGTINPFVQMFYQSESCTNFGNGFNCTGQTDPQGQFMTIIQVEELVAFAIVLTSLILGIVGYRRSDSPAQPAQPPQPVTPMQSAEPALPSSTP